MTPKEHTNLRTRLRDDTRGSHEGLDRTVSQFDLATPEGLAAHLEKQCLKTHLGPQDVVDATLFLASDTSRMMTGQCMVVDGGVVFASA